MCVCMCVCVCVCVHVCVCVYVTSNDDPYPPLSDPLYIILSN